MNEHQHEQRQDAAGAPDPVRVPVSPVAPERDGDHHDTADPDEQQLRPESAMRTVSLDDGPVHSETNVSVVREGIRRYGQSFLAYLILDGVEQRSPDLIEQYEQRYVGSFADRRSFAAWANSDQGWADELIALRQLQGMGPDDVKWDTDRLWPALVERYDLTERLGGVHAFRR